jgi:hypothetical protein
MICAQKDKTITRKSINGNYALESPNHQLRFIYQSPIEVPGRNPKFA